jgi:hypothetical protein
VTNQLGVKSLATFPLRGRQAGQSRQDKQRPERESRPTAAGSRHGVCLLNFAQAWLVGRSTTAAPGRVGPVIRVRAGITTIVGLSRAQHPVDQNERQRQTDPAEDLHFSMLPREKRSRKGRRIDDADGRPAHAATDVAAGLLFPIRMVIFVECQTLLHALDDLGVAWIHFEGLALPLDRRVEVTRFGICGGKGIQPVG